MSEQADAHVHFFERGYPQGFGARPGVAIQDVTVYESLAETHNITNALVVGYEGEAFGAGNNEYLASVSTTRVRVHRLAFVKSVPALNRDALEAWRVKGFAGIALYIFDDSTATALQGIETATWKWLVDNGWPISVNSRGPSWAAWMPVLDRAPDVTVLVSHAGLPPAMDKADTTEAEAGIRTVLALARYPNVHVKLSAFYALTRPSHDYPHGAAWPYVELLLERFGVDRLVWGSDFPPHLEHVSFPQTFELFHKMPFLTDADRKKILRDNLMHILGSDADAA